ncbi:MAG: GNAT family N-acetyltransferase [Rubricoccaceae bacterium]|nr:GNAT family N-acetyltransferase [Rubricoccaceae bacterium]
MSGRAAEPPVPIRRATRADADAIAAVLAEAFQAFEPRYTPAAFRATTPSPEVVRARFDEGPVWVAEADRVIGTVAAVHRPRGVYIRSMAVRPDARGRGLGTRLLRAVEEDAARHACDRLYLSTTPFLDAAIALYERAGYRRTDAPPHDLLGTPLVTMEKRLGRDAGARRPGNRSPGQG